MEIQDTLFVVARHKYRVMKLHRSANGESIKILKIYDVLKYLNLPTISWYQFQ